jgi:hypothetical protein
MPPSTKINYNSATYRAPSTNLSQKGYISYKVHPISYKNSQERYILVTCLAPNCDKTWDLKASLATSTGNITRHMQLRHPNWEPRRDTSTSSQSITDYTSNIDSSVQLKDGLERRIISFLTQNNISIHAICSKSFKEMINFDKRLVLYLY